MTILSITHDIEEAAIIDQIILMGDGHIIQTGTPDQVLKDVKTLESLALDVPFAYKITSALKKKGFPIEETIDQKGLVETLWQLHSKK